MQSGPGSDVAPCTGVGIQPQTESLGVGWDHVKSGGAGCDPTFSFLGGEKGFKKGSLALCPGGTRYPQRVPDTRGGWVGQHHGWMGALALWDPIGVNERIDPTLVNMHLENKSACLFPTTGARTSKVAGGAPIGPRPLIRLLDDFQSDTTSIAPPVPLITLAL
jgi:hypothetical protein